MTIARDWKYISCLWLSKGAIVFPLMQLNVNTYANSVTESSFTLMKFMEVLMNVYWRYSFNRWLKWLYILRKWTAKGVVIASLPTPRLNSSWYQVSKVSTTIHCWNRIAFEVGRVLLNLSFGNTPWFDTALRNKGYCKS